MTTGTATTCAAMTVDGRDLKWSWPDTLPEPTIDGNSATYQGVADGGDLVVTATVSGFRHDVVLHQAPTGAVSYRIPVLTRGPEITEQADGGLAVTTASGDTLVSADKPMMYDAAVTETGAPAHVADVDTDVTETSTGGIVTLNPADSFLHDPSTIYPVTVDPTYNSVNPDDTWVWDTHPDAIHPYDETLYAGTPDGGTTRYRTFIHFEDGPWRAQAVSAATLKIRNFNSTACSGAAVQVRRVIDDWAPGSTTWNEQPTTSATNAVNNSAAYGYSSSCPANDASWNVTGIVKTWAARGLPDGAPNNGFRIAAASETGTASYREFRSANYQYKTYIPKLSVTYNSIPVQPDAPGHSPGADAVTTSSTPSVSTVITDPDGGTLHADFEIYAGASLIWSGSSTSVASGQPATAPVPSGFLNDETTYSVRARANDGSATSEWSGSSDFTVVLAPSAPTGLGVTPCLDDCADDWRVTTSLTPTLQATASDGDATAAQLSYTWELRRAADTEVIATNSTTGLRNQATSWSVPADLLAEDTEYAFRVQTNANGHIGDWSEWTTFSVDTDAGSLSDGARDEALNKAKALVEAQNDVWLTGQDAVDSPRADLVTAAGGRTSGFDAALNDALALRKTVTDEGFTILAGTSAPGRSYVRKTDNGLRVTLEVGFNQTYSEAATGEQSDTSWTDRFEFELPDSTMMAFAASAAETDSVQTAPESGVQDVETLPDVISASPDGEVPVDPSQYSADAQPTGASTSSFAATAALSASPSYDTAAFIDYAKYWTEEPRKNSMNPSYRAYTGNHCADFVSQALNQAGWARTGGINPYLDGNWDDDLFGPAGPSRAWAQAKSLYRYAYDKKRLSWMDNIWNAQPGDMYFVDWDNDGDTAIDHVVAVTGRTNGVPRISSKTNNRHNMLLGTWKMKIAEQRGPNSIWYGLRNQVR